MCRVRAHLTISLDGFATTTDQTPDGVRLDLRLSRKKCLDNGMVHLNYECCAP